CPLAETITLTDGMASLSGTTETSALYQNDYDPTHASCEEGRGNDRVYAVTVPAGERLVATVTPQAGYDATINLVGGPAAMCTASPLVCLRSADLGASGGAETVTYDNNSAASAEIFLIVDGYAASSAGTFTLDVTVAEIPPAPPGDTCQLAEVI